MPIVSHTLLQSSNSGNRDYVVYQFTDNETETHNIEKYVPVGFDTDADMLSMYAELDILLADKEINDALYQAEILNNPDKVAIHQSQADFDRRVLGRLMQEENAHIVLAALPFFQAMELRGGANAGQRAAYLGVTTEDYNLVDNRFGDVQGVSFFLNDEKDQVWTDIHEGWE
jgi:hypothetical protein